MADEFGITAELTLRSCPVSHTGPTNYRDVDDTNGLHFLRDELECENVGVTVLECDPGWEGKEHDHGESGRARRCAVTVQPTPGRSA